MSMMRAMRRRMRSLVAPSVFLALVAYFGWNATQGQFGLKAYAHREQDLARANQTLADASGEYATWQLRVASLDSAHLDPDALDERARAMLNLARPAEIVVLYGSHDKLF